MAKMMLLNSGLVVFQIDANLTRSSMNVLKVTYENLRFVLWRHDMDRFEQYRTLLFGGGGGGGGGGGFRGSLVTDWSPQQSASKA